MSQLGNEIKVLFILNSKAKSKRYIPMSEIIEEFGNYGDVSPRQIRRYLHNLSQETKHFQIDTKFGPNGGYRLEKPLSDSYTLSQDLMLALTLSSKGNTKMEESLRIIPNYVTYDCIDNSYGVDEIMFDSLEKVLKSCIESTKIEFTYKKDLKNHIVKPYRIKYVNHSAYLMCIEIDNLKYYDIAQMDEVKQKEQFKQVTKIFNQIKQEAQEYFGVWSSGAPGIVQFKYLNENGKLRFTKVFEGKGMFDDQNRIFTIKAFDKHIIYLKLLEISTKDYEFINKNDKKEYIKHLQKVINSLNK